jgi:membrane peptidoglycan carboxypeptidase
MARANRDRDLTAGGVVSHLGVMLAVSALVGLLVAGIAIPFAALAGLGARAGADSLKDLPADLTAEPLAQRTKVLDVNGKPLATWYDQNRVNVQLDEVSLIMRKAIVAIEDYRFYQHGALDLKGTLRAFITNQASDGVVQGGSSITQQMVKQTLINQARNKAEVAAAQADTYERKFNELRYAIAFEDKYSKDWILERYLNVAYFGDGAYGIEAAARRFFSVPASRLTLRQAALLAGLVKNPSKFDPTDNPQEARARRNVVLERMRELGVIPDQRAAAVSRTGLGLKTQPTRNGCVGVTGEFFCDYLKEYLLDDPQLGRTTKERRRLLFAGGLTIRTTIDPAMQRAADAAVRARVNPTDQAIGGLAMVEPGTGEVRALAQSRPMGADKAKGRTYLNYVVPREYGDSGGFAAGSTFKTFVLAAAIKQGIPLSTQIRSPGEVFLPNNTFETCDGPLQSTDTWSPENSTGDGTFDLYTGTRQSVNTFFAQLEQRTGLCDPVTIAKDTGVQVPDTDIVPPFTLGVTNTNPLTMAGAYATFAARGQYCEPRPVTEILDANGKVLADYAPRCSQVLQAPVADAVNDVLAGVQEPGGFGFNAGLALSQDSAGKTGTINDNKAVWFVGYTPNMSAAAMIAGANSLGYPITLNGQYVGGQYISRAFGSTQAGPIWGQAMRAIEGSLPDVDFVEPDPTAIMGQIVDVPDVTGQEAADAADELREAGFVPNVGRYVDSRLPKGQVAYTSPVAGARVGSGTLVTMFISDGTPRRSGGGGGDADTSGDTSGGDGGGTTDGGGGGTATTGPGNNGNGNGNGNGRGRRRD